VKADFAAATGRHLGAVPPNLLGLCRISHVLHDRSFAPPASLPEAAFLTSNSFRFYAHTADPCDLAFL